MTSSVLNERDHLQVLFNCQGGSKPTGPLLTYSGGWLHPSPKFSSIYAANITHIVVITKHREFFKDNLKATISSQVKQDCKKTLDQTPFSELSVEAPSPSIGSSKDQVYQFCDQLVKSLKDMSKSIDLA
eukprot:Platyproteum_vivax@DN1071_c0_g1_i1.p1